MVLQGARASRGWNVTLDPTIETALPPHDLEAERMLIGAWLRAPDPKWIARTHVAPEDFYLDAHRRAAACIQSLSGSWVEMGREQAWALKRIAEAEHQGHVEQVMDTFRIGAQSTAWFGGCVELSKAVRELATRRRAHQASRALLDDMARPDVDAQDALRRYGKALSEAGRGDGRLDGLAAEQALGAMEILQRTTAELRELGYLRWYVPTLDRRGLLIGPDDFVIVAARPSCGKTTFLHTWAFKVAEDTGRPVIFLAYETEGRRIVADALLARAGVQDPKGRGITNDDDARRLHAAYDDMARIPVYLPTDPTPRVYDLVAWMRGVSEQYKPAAWVVDYLGLLDSPGKSTYERTGQISKALRQVALSARVPVLAACQLNRASATDKREPQLHDLRDAGNLEQDAVTVVMLHNPAMTGERQGPPLDQMPVTLMVPKNRHGGAGHRVQMILDGPRKRITEAVS